MNAPRSWKVKEVAEEAGVSVRALHHYDEIGLLSPSRSESGYRLYTGADLLRLQQILVMRELGMPLETIRRTLDDPKFDRRKALRTHRAELAQRQKRTDTMLAAIDRALAALDAEAKGETMSLDGIFDGFDPAAYEAEARERWGKTEAWRESQRRTKRYSKDDWKRINAEHGAIYDDFAAALKAGLAPESADVRAIVERHRLHIDRWYYPCSIAQQRALADLYEADPRFAGSIDKHGAGLTPYVVTAIRSAPAETAG